MEESSLVPHLRAAAEQQREIESLQRELEATVSRADDLRDEILALGYVLEDTREGTKVSRA